MAFSVVAFDKFAQLMEVSANCGFSAHFKGEHDGFFGTHKHVFDEHVSALPDGVLVETLPEAVDIHKTWADGAFEEHGLRVHCEEFMPQDRSCS